MDNYIHHSHTSEAVQAGGTDTANTEHIHSHSHHHDPDEKKRQLNRLARIIGHLQHVRSLIENDEDCSAVLMQLSAVKSALNGLGKEIINEHISHCIVHAMKEGDMEAIEEFQKAIERYVQ